jgi:hypothetical protein
MATDMRRAKDSARRADRVNLVLECVKVLEPPSSLSPATSTAATVRAMHLRIGVPCAAGSGGGVRLRPSVVAARSPLSKH